MKSNVPRHRWQLQTPPTALRESNHVAKMKEILPVSCSVYLEDTCQRKALALIMCLCLSSFYIHFNPDLMVSFAAIYKGISIEMHTANQCKALCLDILKKHKKKPGLKAQVEAQEAGGILFAYPNLPSWHTILFRYVHSWFIFWLASQLFPRFSRKHSS